LNPFLGKVRKLGDARLHPERHFVLLGARLDIGITQRLVAPAVELLQAVEHLAAQLARDTRGVVQIQDRVARRTERDAGVLSGQEARTP